MRSARIEVATSEEDFDTSVAYTITVRVRNWLGQVFQTLVCRSVIYRLYNALFTSHDESLMFL
jgi:hypothetical protein